MQAAASNQPASKPEVRVEVGVSIPPHLAHEHSHARQNLNDAIRISIKKNSRVQSLREVNFLQFITHQAPDQFAFDHEEGRVAWEGETEGESNYMRDAKTPRWRVDAHPDGYPDPFYETCGVHEEDAEWISVYDQPAYAFDHKMERIIGCTFLIDNQEVFAVVHWSRQFVKEEAGVVSQYCYRIEEIGYLPEWVSILYKTLIKPMIMTVE